jgi:hypothetical protein
VDRDDLEEMGTEVAVACSRCGHTNNIAAVNKGNDWKYCRVCEQLQPLDSFDRHVPSSASFRSGRQLECRSCKRLINAKLNPLRTGDQHRESSERRRLYGLLAGETRLNAADVHRRFGGECFNCGRPLTQREGAMDHTLPARNLWPQTMGATLLCHECNAFKAEKWPSEFYRRGADIDREKLQRLSYLTGIPYETLAGPPYLNPEAVQRILANVDEFLIRWIRYPDEIRRLRGTIRQMVGSDIFQYASAAAIPDFLREAEDLPWRQLDQNEILMS